MTKEEAVLLQNFSPANRPTLFVGRVANDD